MPFPRLLRQMADTRSTGAIAIYHHDSDRKTTTGEAPKKVVYFRNGIPAYVESNLVHECLGHMLVRQGKIDRSILEESVKRMHSEKRKQGDILVALGVLSTAELNEALQEQLQRKLFDLFGWRHASFHLLKNESKLPGIIRLEMGLAEVIFEGVVRQIPPQRLLRLLEPHMTHYVVPNHQRAEVFLKMDLVDEARDVVLKLNGSMTMSQVLRTATKRPGAVAQLLYAMATVEALRFSLEPDQVASVQDYLAETQSFMVPSPEQESTAPASTTAEAPVPEYGSYATTEVTSGETPNQRTRSKNESVTANADPAPATETTNTEQLDREVELTFQAERLFRLGKRSLRNKEYDRALLLFNQAHKLCPDEGEFMLYVGYLTHLMADGKPKQNEKAKKIIERAIEHAPHLYEAHLFYARVLRSLAKDGNAKSALQRAIALEPQRSEAQEELEDLDRDN
ncbi:MAG: DUF4388 domain-containing protein [Myxococcales bacterium]|nr:MAG: DUF4388 domain-containing protein [Myxococcales bacterium]